MNARLAGSVSPLSLAATSAGALPGAPLCRRGAGPRGALFGPLGHQRLRRAAELLQVGAEDRLLLPLLAAERDAGRRLGGQHAGDQPAVLERRLVLDVPRVEVAVRVEDG